MRAAAARVSDLGSPSTTGRRARPVAHRSSFPSSGPRSARALPITASETLATRWSFRERRAVGLAMLDVSWRGGLSEAREIAAMAEANQLPVAPHDCTGPVVFMASVHLSMNATYA